VMVFLCNHSHLLSHWSCDFVAYLMCTHLLTPSVSALLDCASCLLVLCSGWLRLDTSFALHCASSRWRALHFMTRPVCHWLTCMTRCMRLYSLHSLVSGYIGVWPEAFAPRSRLCTLPIDTVVNPRLLHLVFGCGIYLSSPSAA